MKLQARKRWSHQKSPCFGDTLLTRCLDTDVGCSTNGEESICSVWSGYNCFYNLFSNRVRRGHCSTSLLIDWILMRWHPTVNIVELALALLLMKRRGREWSRREPSDIDEARRVSSTGGERINRTGA